MSRKLFCNINPTCYAISLKKENVKRYIIDFFHHIKIAKHYSKDELPNIVKSHSSILLRKLNGVDDELQKSKITNIKLACNKINGLIIRPGETFSFWRVVGHPTKAKGYVDGLVIGPGGFSKGIGGGLCQMANMIHYLVLHSPLEVSELHHHSDALFPDDRRRAPFGTGTSISYISVDYRFKNTTNQDMQILVWCENDALCGELRSEYKFPYRYKLVEENHHYKKENNEYFRISQIYKITIDQKTKREINKELILDNHSAVMYDYSLIPKDEIKE